MYSRVDVEHGRESKRDGLARASLRDSDHVPTTESHGPGLALNGGRSVESLGANGSHKVLGEVDFVKGGDRTRDSTTLNLKGLLASCAYMLSRCHSLVFPWPV